MHDQANQLRRLVSDATAPRADRDRERPILLVVAGGKGGVGTTTVAVNLAVELALAKSRTVLVDADPNGGDVAVLCGLEDRYTIVDVMAVRATVLDALVSGPGGVRILPGAWAVDNLARRPAADQARLIGQLEGLAHEADVIVADAGNGRDALAQRLWHAADRIVVLTTAELASVMDAYGSIKVLRPEHKRTPVHSLVNMASGSPSAGDVQNRLARACTRFLGLHLNELGHLPQDPHIIESTRTQRPVVLAVRQSRWSCRIRRAAAKLGPSQKTRPRAA